MLELVKATQLKTSGQYVNTEKVISVTLKTAGIVKFTLV